MSSTASPLHRCTPHQQQRLHIQPSLARLRRQAHSMQTPGLSGLHPSLMRRAQQRRLAARQPAAAARPPAPPAPGTRQRTRPRRRPSRARPRRRPPACPLFGTGHVWGVWRCDSARVRVKKRCLRQSARTGQLRVLRCLRGQAPCYWPKRAAPGHTPVEPCYSHISAQFPGSLSCACFVQVTW